MSYTNESQANEGGGGRTERVRAALLQLMQNPAAELPQVALLPRIKAAAGRLRAVGELNRNVHVEHYNRIIGEVARKASAV